MEAFKFNCKTKKSNAQYSICTVSILLYYHKVVKYNVVLKVSLLYAITERFSNIFYPDLDLLDRLI